MEHSRGGGGRVKVFIVSDMEGVAGIVKWQQTDGTKEKRAYHEGRELYTEEINAAVRGAKAAGAKEIVVMDCHGAGEEWAGRRRVAWTRALEVEESVGSEVGLALLHLRLVV